MKNGEENGRDQDSLQKRHITVIPLTDDPAYCRYICNQCLWSVDVLKKNAGEGEPAFAAHDCKEYRHRDSLT